MSCESDLSGQGEQQKFVTTWVVLDVIRCFIWAQNKQNKVTRLERLQTVIQDYSIDSDYELH